MSASASWLFRALRVPLPALLVGMAANSPSAQPAAPRAELLHTLKGHTLSVYHAVFSPDGKLLATSSKDHSVKLWDAAAGTEVRTLQGHKGEVYSSAFRADGKQLVTAGDDRTVKLWNPATGELLRTFTGHKGDVYNAAFSPDGTIIASASQDQTVRLWDAATGKPRLTLTGHTARVCSVVFSPDGRFVASSSPSAASPDSEDPRGEVKVWRVADGEAVLSLSVKNAGVVTLAYSPDGRRLAGACLDRTVKLWEVATGRQTLSLKGHTLSVYHLAFSGDGRRLASSSSDYTASKGGEVKLWELPGGRELLSFQPHTQPIWSVAFHRDGRRLTTTAGIFRDKPETPGEVKLWELRNLPAAPSSPAPTPARLETLWKSLGGSDAVEAYRAVWTLSEAPAQTIPFLRQRVRPLKARATEADIARLIRDLDDSDFAVREKAAATLEQLGRLARPALLKVRHSPSLEVRRRVASLLEKQDDGLPPLSPDEMRALRMVEVLLRIGTPDVRPLLEKLADGAKESPVAQEAAAALGLQARLSRKKP